MVRSEEFGPSGEANSEGDMHHCLYAGCERSFLQPTQLEDHQVRDHARATPGQPENPTASLRQETFLAASSRKGSYSRLLFHSSQGADIPYDISGEEDYWRSRHASQGSDIPRYVQAPLDILVPGALWSLNGYQPHFGVSPRLDLGTMLPPFAAYPTPGGKRKPACIEDHLSRDASCDSGIYLGSQRKERKIVHHQDLGELKAEGGPKAEAAGDPIFTPEPRCPYLERIGLADDSFMLQNQHMTVTPIWPYDSLSGPREPYEIRRHSFESPTWLSESPPKSHEPYGLRRHSFESQSVTPPSPKYADNCSPLETYEEQYIQPETTDGISRVPLCQETGDLSTRSVYGDNTNQTKNSSGKEVASPKKQLPQPYSHEQLSKWMNLLPSIQRDYAKIMGGNNNGSIQLINENGQGIVAVTCKYPKRVRSKALGKKLDCLGLEIKIQKGDIGTSDQRGNHEWPAINGHHTVQPSSGASLGVSKNEKLEASVSLGGYVKIRKTGSRTWKWYATTSHHLLEDGIDTESDRGESGHSDGSDDDYDGDWDDISEDEDGSIGDGEGVEGVEGGEWRPTNSEVLTPGVRDGALRLEDELPRTFEIQSPSKIYHDRALERLKERKNFVKDFPGLEDLLQLDGAIRDLEKANTFFGKVEESSGLCIEGNKQMDWLLIGSIPRERIGSNDNRDWSSFVEGVPRGSRSQPSSRLAFVSEDKFHSLTSVIHQYYEKHGDRPCPYSRIHGSGCESGLSDGQLLVPPVVVQLNNMSPTTEWTFKPRRNNGLGTFGDSGTWLYTALGELLGQVLGYDPKNDVAFYTPIYLIFDHMKKHIGAEDIQLPTKEDYNQQQFVKPSPILIPSTPRTPRKASTMPVHNPLSLLLTPPEDASDRDTGPTPHPLVCLASEGARAAARPGLVCSCARALNVFGVFGAFAFGV
ncbi:hypothetical protein FGG08_005903 [Glutinoglossum americanum]|uniref:C2H2-type domain-containing protein n=1 Tax=Glutinoglossum americanum TaxID=1670608 RepID=A0A9P8I6B7_9PEZI|nr:hypothetical protein FGG08_005903 [Glutinoglossum americanum]